VVRCGVCLQPVPITFEQEHHEVPQAAGGREGRTVSLCAGCHHNLHRVADMLQHGKAGVAQDSVEITYRDPGARERMMVLAKTVAEYMILKRDGRIDSDEPVRVTIELPVQVKLAAQVMANDHRGPTGRRMGLGRWIVALVEREVYQRYPNLKPTGATHAKHPRGPQNYR